MALPSRGVAAVVAPAAGCLRAYGHRRSVHDESGLIFLNVGSGHRVETLCISPPYDERHSVLAACRRRRNLGGCSRRMAVVDAAPCFGSIAAHLVIAAPGIADRRSNELLVYALPGLTLAPAGVACQRTHREPVGGALVVCSVQLGERWNNVEDVLWLSWTLPGMLLAVGKA